MNTRADSISRQTCEAHIRRLHKDSVDTSKSRALNRSANHGHVHQSVFSLQTYDNFEKTLQISRIFCTTKDALFNQLPSSPLSFWGGGLRNSEQFSRSRGRCSYPRHENGTRSLPTWTWPVTIGCTINHSPLLLANISSNNRTAAGESEEGEKGIFTKPKGWPVSPVILPRFRSIDAEMRWAPRL